LENEFLKWMDEPDLLNEEAEQKLIQIIQKYPYFQTAHLLYLKLLSNKEGMTLEQIAHNPSNAHVGDRQRLLSWLQGNDLSQAPPHHHQDKTDHIISYSTDQLLKDYIKKLPDNNTQNLSPQKQKKQHLIDNFIAEAPTLERLSPHADDIEEENPVVEVKENIVTEQLAKIYVRQGYYEKAIKAFEKLSLKYPEKSDYFASQIKSVKKLEDKISID